MKVVYYPTLTRYRVVQNLYYPVPGQVECCFDRVELDLQKCYLNDDIRENFWALAALLVQVVLCVYYHALTLAQFLKFDISCINFFQNNI